MTTTLSVRVDDEMVKVLDELAAELSERAGGVEIERSAAARAAIKRGAEILMSERSKKR